MATFRLPRTLTWLAWEEQFDPRHGPIDADETLSRRVTVDGLHLDFTNVEFAEFGVLARALLLLDASVHHQMPATVTLPASDLSVGETQRLRRFQAAGREPETQDILLAHRVRAHSDVLSFMRQVGFLDALRAPHWSAGSVRLLEGSTAAAEQPSTPVSGEETAGPDPRDVPYRPRRVLPFRWLEPMRGERLRESESFIAITEELRDLGLSESDAYTVSQTVLTELVENVAGDDGFGIGEPPLVLVGAFLFNADTYALRQKSMLAQLAELAECALTDGSHVLRLIVGHSASDLFTRIGSALSDLDASAGIKPAGSATPSEDYILRAFANRAVSQRPADEAQRGALGLWRIARMVRSYRGSVLVRTANAMAGLVYSQVADGTEIKESVLGYAPGTLFDVNLLTDPRSKLPASPLEHRSSVADGTRLRWVNCGLDPLHGLGEYDRARLEKEAREAQRDPAFGGVLVSIPVGEVDWHQTDYSLRDAIRAVLDVMTRIATRGAIVVLHPDTDPRILDLCVAGFNEESAAAENPDGSIPNPVLVLGAYGDVLWCGGSRPLRAVLVALSAAGGILTAVDAKICWQEAGGDVAEFWPAVRAQDRHIRLGNGILELLVSTGSVQTTLAAAAHEDLSQAVTKGSAGVRRGRFRAPSLRVTSRWIDVERLVAKTVGTQVAAYVLARKVEAELSSSPKLRPPTAAGRLATATRPLVRQFSECLRLGGRYYSLPAELDIGDLPVGERVPRGADVVLCTDLISTENAVRRAAAIAGGEADPLIIACIVDARDTAGPIELLNRTIPVVSLTKVDISCGHAGAENDEPIIDIDPFLLRPHVPVPPPQSSVQETELLQWCATAPDALRLGHVDFPPHRHFSAFIRLDQALRRREIREKITDAVMASIQDAFSDMHGQSGRSQLTDEAFDIWYVASRDGNAKRLAEAVHMCLTSRGIKVGELIPVRRGIAGDAWAFPSTVGRTGSARSAVIIAWSAVTGTTMLQMTRLAAASGASHVIAVSMLNQMDPQDAAVLGMLRAVSAPAVNSGQALQAGGDASTSSIGSIPVAIRFVTVSSITAPPAHDCAVCATQENYELSGEGAPRRLHLHAEQLREMLQPRGSEEVSRDAPADLFTVPISGDDVVDYLRWRGLLLRGLRNLSARQEVVDHLRMLTEPKSSADWTRSSLIRLLAAEQQWLKLPPLRFTVARDLLANACISSLEQSLTTPSWLRLQALIVLCATAPERLTEQMPSLLAHVLDEAVLVDQLFLDCYRLLLRPPRDSPIDVEQLRHNLVQCRDYLEIPREGYDPRLIDDYEHVVGELITIADYRIMQKPTDARAAWNRLREDLMRSVIRHSLESELLLVRSFVEDLEEVWPTLESARAARAEWDICARQLQERALVNLPALRDIISGEYVSDVLGRKEQRRLLTLAHADTSELRAVTDRLHTLTYEPWRPENPSWQELRRELLDRINWWNHVFVAAHIPDRHTPALLVDLVGSAPARLGARVSNTLASQGADAMVDQLDQGDVLVFCPEKLLDQVVGHLIGNAQRHRTPGAACRMHIRYEDEGPEHIRLILRNTGTKPRTPPGQGLKALNDKLRPFGGELMGRVVAEDEWTFEAIATLPLWQRR